MNRKNEFVNKKQYRGIDFYLNHYRKVLDFDLLGWLSRAYVNYPDVFDDMKSKNGTYNTRDITMLLYRSNQKTLGSCLQDIITVGFIDTNTIGCVASDIVLYLVGFRYILFHCKQYCILKIYSRGVPSSPARSAQIDAQIARDGTREPKIHTLVLSHLDLSR